MTWTTKAVAAATCLLLVQGCYRPVASSDGISPTAGVAPRYNVEAQTVYPNAGNRAVPNPGGEGLRVASVIDRYQSGAPAATPAVENAVDN